MPSVIARAKLLALIFLLVAPAVVTAQPPHSMNTPILRGAASVLAPATLMFACCAPTSATTRSAQSRWRRVGR